MEAALFGIVILILSVIVHEVAHGYAAALLGDPTAKLAGRLTLNPLPHIDPIGSVLIPAFLVLTNAGFLFGWAKPVPYNPYNLKNRRWGEAIVGIAGVATNLFIAIVFAIVARVAFAGGYGTFGSLAALVTLTNLYLGLFNLIPVPPLDGFTVLRGLLPYQSSMAFRALEARFQSLGIFALLGFLFLFVYLLSPLFSALVSYLFALLIGA